MGKLLIFKVLPFKSNAVGVGKYRSKALTTKVKFKKENLNQTDSDFWLT